MQLRLEYLFNNMGLNQTLNTLVVGSDANILCIF